MRIIAGYCSSRTRFGLKRIGQILEPDFEMQTENPSQDAEAVILHNQFLETDFEKPTIAFLCEGKALQLSEDIDLQEKAKKCVVEVWVNCRYSKDVLQKFSLEYGVPVKLMYRPNKLVFPGTIPDLPREKRLLWYWIAGQEKYENVRDRSEATIVELGQRGWQINYIASVPVGEPPVEEEYTKVLGRVDLPTVLPEMRGMVQLNTSHGIGRSCFQVMASGRAVTCIMIDDLGIYRIWLKDNWPDKIEAAMSQPMPNQWMKPMFTEEGLHKSWVAELERVIDEA